MKLKNLAIIAVLLPVATALTACGEEGFEASTNDHFYEKAAEFLNAFGEPDNDKVMELACPDSRLYERAESGELDGAKEPFEIDLSDPKVSKVGVEEMGKEVIAIIKPDDDYKALAVSFAHPSPDSERWCVTGMDQDDYGFFRN
ncbi:hypothetical protein [Corynebacterium amycolatum]|uniref:hypothetical protein n=1 Tax=Corynebacterium amycolatum TaxID=43765 RepID=UPI000185BFB7|nr:hypothetical protein [Corynebacterium amycolatum]EEB63656.1 hypothetical protein CORAM0001_1296 [Corynebacterium amycolatum SK46]